jgi:hypothetical protein
MNRVKFVLPALLAGALLFLASCGEHSLDDVFGDIFGVSSSSEEASGGMASSSSGGTASSSSLEISDNSSSSGTASSSSIKTDYSYLKMEAIYVPETRIQNIAEYQVEVKSYTFNTKNGKTLEVYYSFPKTSKGNAKILFTLHGSEEPAAGFIEIYKYISETENIIVIAPDFVAQFPGASQYNELGISSNINNPENWASKIIDEIFLDFKGRFGLSNDKYILYGFSAGGQFTHRATMFSESPYMEYSISTAPGGWMTFPDDQVNYPYGIKNFLMYKDLMDRNFGRKMYLLSGNRDSITFDSRPAASFQGSSRHDRELNFYQTSKDYCEQNGLFFNIDLIVMDGMGHSNSGPRPYVIDIVKGIYSAKKENAQ